MGHMCQPDGDADGNGITAMVTLSCPHAAQAFSGSQAFVLSRTPSVDAKTMKTLMDRAKAAIPNFSEYSFHVPTQTQQCQYKWPTPLPPSWAKKGAIEDMSAALDRAAPSTLSRATNAMSSVSVPPSFRTSRKRVCSQPAHVPARATPSHTDLRQRTFISSLLRGEASQFTSLKRPDRWRT